MLEEGFIISFLLLISIKSVILIFLNNFFVCVLVGFN